MKVIVVYDRGKKATLGFKVPGAKNMEYFDADGSLFFYDEEDNAIAIFHVPGGLTKIRVVSLSEEG